MKEILNDYKEQVKYFISNKKYLILVTLVAALSYGFTITHYSIGVDDLCFDRYVKGTYLLSAKRWGTWLLYNVLGISEFTPFWLDFIATVVMVIIAIILCAFIRKQYGDKINIWGYIIFSSLLISNPLIYQFFTYQSANLPIAIGNLITIICEIAIFENYFNKNKKYINIISGLILTIPIAMYESCAQTYIVLLFATIFVKIVQDKISNKELFKYFCLSISMLILGIILYFITGKIIIFLLDKFGVLQIDFAFHGSLWLTEKFKNLSLIGKIEIIKKKTIYEISRIVYKFLPVTLFFTLSFISILLECINLIKTNKVSRMISLLGMIFSNFILIFILLSVEYRMQFSWIVTTAFLGLYVYHKLCNKKILKYIINIVAILLVLNQTRILNQYFYNDYKRYEKEKVIANDIAINVIKNCDYKNKFLVFVTKKGARPANRYNSVFVMDWGLKAFCEAQTEIIKFINEQGYNFSYITEKRLNYVMKKYEELEEDTKKETIIELENAIIVNLDAYNFL